MSSLPRKVGKRSQYPEAFKRDAVRLSTERSVKVAAKELGLSASMLSKWRKHCGESKGNLYARLSASREWIEDVLAARHQRWK